MQTFLKMKDAAFKLFDIQQRQAQSKFNAGMNKTVSTMTQLGKIPQRFQGLSLKSAIEDIEKNSVSRKSCFFYHSILAQKYYVLTVILGNASDHGFVV